MKKVEYTGTVKDFVDGYDKKDHSIWNNTSGQVVDVRSVIRQHYLKEQAYCCAYCRIEKKESHGMTWDVEHILPKAIFPEYLFEPENLAVACKECNTPKDDVNILANKSKVPEKFPVRSKDYIIVHPHFDVYDHHFEIIEVQGKRIYRLRNGHKAKQTYIICNLSRFDYKFAEWDSFDSAMVERISGFLDSCPQDATPSEIKRMLGHLVFTKKA